MIPDARYQIIIVFLLLQVLCVQAQDSVSRYFIFGARYNYGVVFRHSKTLAKEVQANPMGYQADFTWHFVNKTAKDYCNCYPRIGFSFYYWDYRNPGILGHGLTLLAFAEPFFNAHNRVSFSLRAGIGLNYQDTPYDSVENPLNMAYSTHFAYAVLLGFNAYFKVSPHLKLVLAANYNHISNGGIKLPNKGLNYPGFSIGLDYSFRKAHFPKIRADELQATKFQRRWRKDFGLFLGFRGITDDEKLYYVVGVFGQFAWQFGRVSTLPIGLEYLHDGGELARSRIYSSISYRAANRVSIYSGYEYLLGRLVLSFNLGMYVYSPDLTAPLLYQRYGFRVRLFKMVFIGLNLKAHGHIADFFDVRAGASF